MKSWSLNKWKKEAKKVFQRWVRISWADFDGNVTCVTCGVTKNWKEMDAGHFIPATYLSTCFDEYNCHPQCKRCNCWLEGAREEYFVWMEKYYGRKEVDRLIAQKNKQVKLKYWDYQQIIDKYTNACIGLEKQKGL